MIFNIEVKLFFAKSAVEDLFLKGGESFLERER